MSTIEITSKIEALKELEALIEEAKTEAETLRDEIKAEMLNRNTEEMEAGQYIVRSPAAGCSMICKPTAPSAHSSGAILRI